MICFFCSGSFSDDDIHSLIGLLEEKEVSLVGISTVTDDYRSAVQVTRQIKERTDLPVIWGGAHANVRPEECLRHADMVCLGEGEEALLELTESLGRESVIDTTIRNIWFKTDQGIIRNPLRPLEENLDKYPAPDFDLSSQYVMTNQGLEPITVSHLMNEYSIMTSRGCPYSCNYCYNSYRRKQYKGKGRYMRTRSISTVIEELYRAKELFPDLTLINFWDDSFVARKLEDFNQFKELYVKEINLPFFALIEPMAFNYEKIKILKESGLKSLQVGIQSGSERVNKEIYNRRVSNDKVVTMARQLHDLGLEVIYDVIFNNPFETREDIFETIKLFIRFPEPFSVQGFNLIFYPGTEMTTRALQDGYISEKHEGEDFSTIEGRADSPIVSQGKSKISGRFYTINFDASDKKYLNGVISLLAYNRVPLSLVGFFGSSETPLKRFLLSLFVKFYTTASFVRNNLLH